jgi:S1-C subfamily serine protease
MPITDVACQTRVNGANVRVADVSNGTNVGDASVLDRLISDVRISSTITLGVVRGGRHVEVRVSIVRPTRDGPIRN